MRWLLPLWSSFTALLTPLHSGSELYTISCTPCVWLLEQPPWFQSEKEQTDLFPWKDCTYYVRMAQPSWKPTNHITNTQKNAFNLVLKNTFQNCSKRKFSYRFPAWNNGTVLLFQCKSSSFLRKIKPLGKSSTIFFLIFESKSKILVVIKGWGHYPISVLRIFVMNKITNCWWGPLMLCVRLHSHHVKSVPSKLPWGCFAGSWTSPGPPACLKGITHSDASLSIAVTRRRSHLDPNQLPSKQNKSQPPQETSVSVSPLLVDRSLCNLIDLDPGVPSNPNYSAIIHVSTGSYLHARARCVCLAQLLPWVCTRSSCTVPLARSGHQQLGCTQHCQHH